MKEKQAAIGNDYRIRRITLNWIIEKRTPPTKKRPEGGWKIQGRYPGWEFLALGLIELHNETPEGSSLDEQVATLIEQVRTTERKIIRALGVALMRGGGMDDENLIDNEGEMG